MTRLNLVGQRYGSLVVQECVGTNHRGATQWRCHCDCGRTCVVLAGSLRSQNTRSCGCLKSALMSAHPYGTTHGLKHHSAYGTWGHMVRRCTNPADAAWEFYGGRGITVCERWMSVENFVEDMGERPPKLTLERINNDLGYFPENCRWATMKEQLRNTRATRKITFNGRTLCLKDWAREVGITPASLIYRLKRYSYEVALTSPKRRGRRVGVFQL